MNNSDLNQLSLNYTVFPFVFILLCIYNRQNSVFLMQKIRIYINYLTIFVFVVIIIKQLICFDKLRFIYSIFAIRRH
jgi:hypothetical protein